MREQTRSRTSKSRISSSMTFVLAYVRQYPVHFTSCVTEPENVGTKKHFSYLATTNWNLSDPLFKVLTETTTQRDLDFHTLEAL